MLGISPEMTAKLSSEMLPASKNARSGSFLYEIPSGVVIWPEETQRLYGFKPGEFKGDVKMFWECIDPRDEERTRLGLEASLVLGTFSETYRIRRRDNGEQRWISAQGRVLFDAERRAVQMNGICTDVTEQRRSEDALRFLSAIVASANEAIIGKTLDGRISSWNKSAERLYGYTAEDVIGKPISILIPSHHPDELAGILKAIGEGKKIEPYETQRMDRSGRLIDVFLTVSPIMNEEGEVLGASSIALDLSERKQLEAELRRSEGLFRSIFENAAVGIEQVSLNGRISMVNQAFCDMLGYESAADLIGLHEDEITDEQKDRHAQPGQGALQTTERRFLHKDGSIVWGSVASTLVQDQEGKNSHRISIIQDIGHRKHLQDRLTQVDKLEAIGKLAGGIAHDFNNLLNIVVGHCDMILLGRQPGDLDRDVREGIEGIRKASRTGAAVTRQLLAFSRQQTAEYHRVQINEAVMSFSRILAPLLGGAARIVTDLSPDASWEMSIG